MVGKYKTYTKNKENLVRLLSRQKDSSYDAEVYHSAHKIPQQSV